MQACFLGRQTENYILSWRDRTIAFEAAIIALSNQSDDETTAVIGRCPSWDRIREVFQNEAYKEEDSLPSGSGGESAV